jgi:hypothetical protein
MKVSTTYTFKANSSYIYYDRLNFTDRRDPNNEVAMDVELSFDELCRFAEQLNVRIKRVKQDQLDKARKELEEASEEC